MPDLNYDSYSSINMCGACATRGACVGGNCPGPDAAGILASGGVNCCPGCANAIGCLGNGCDGPTACLQRRFGMRGKSHGNVGCTTSLAKREYSRANNTLQELPRVPGRNRPFPPPETQRLIPRVPPPPTTEMRYPDQPGQPQTQLLQPRMPAPPTSEVLQPRTPTPPTTQVLQPRTPMPPTSDMLQPRAPAPPTTQVFQPSQPVPKAQVAYVAPPVAGPKAQVAYAAPPMAAATKTQVAYVAPPPVAAPKIPVAYAAPVAAKTPTSTAPIGTVTKATGAVDMYGIPQGYGPSASGQTVTARVTQPPANMTRAQQILWQAAQDRALQAAQETTQTQINATRAFQIEREHTITNLAGVVGNAIGETGSTIRAVFQSSNDTALARLQIQSNERIEAMRQETARLAAAGGGGGAASRALADQMAALQTFVTTIAARREEIATPPPTQTTTQGLTAAPTPEEVAAAQTKKVILYSALGVGGVAVVGTVAYFALRKKEPHSNPHFPSYPPGAYASQYGIR